ISAAVRSTHCTVILWPGFLLVTNEPECNEVWVSRNAAIYSDEGQLFQGPGVRTQAEMLEHFLPLMRLQTQTSKAPLLELGLSVEGLPGIEVYGA
ncbi:unnamed protein product, partial [Symbiodinium microadriaticum]